MKAKLLTTVLVFQVLTALGQKNIEGKHVRTDQSTCFVAINSDGTFKYEFGLDLQWDVACGQYERKGDSIVFHYLSDMIDPHCNTEGINRTDTTGIILRDAIDKRFRPIIARISKNQIRTYKVGDLDDPETVRKGVYRHRRMKGR